MEGTPRGGCDGGDATAAVPPCSGPNALLLCASCAPIPPSSPLPVLPSSRPAHFARSSALGTLPSLLCTCHLSLARSSLRNSEGGTRTLPFLKNASFPAAAPATTDASVRVDPGSTEHGQASLQSRRSRPETRCNGARRCSMLGLVPKPTFQFRMYQTNAKAARSPIRASHLR
jgi:hypothetical protein